MGVWVLHDYEAERAVLYDSTSESALQEPSFLGVTAREQAWSFLAYLHTEHNARARLSSDLVALRPDPTDPRHHTGMGVERAYFRWRELCIDADGRLNEYGWQLCTWLEEQPTYGQPREPAPEPGAEKKEAVG